MIRAIEILKQIEPYAILVGSASRSNSFNDIDLVVSQKGLDLAKKIFPKWTSIFIGQVTTNDVEIQIEAMMYWYGPDYNHLCRRNLNRKELFGISFRTYSANTFKIPNGDN